MVRLHITVITGNVTYAITMRTFTTAMPTISVRERYGEKRKKRRTADGNTHRQCAVFCANREGSLHAPSSAAGAVEDEEQENDDDDPREGVVFKEVAKASHDKPPGFSAVF